MAQHKINGGVITISDEIEVAYPQLVSLVLATESMDNSEKQAWFDILPSMTDEQIDRLFDILQQEKTKLEQIEAKYQDEIRILNEKYLKEWEEFQKKSPDEKVVVDKDTRSILDLLESI